jgi:hypothetical protein
MALALNEFGWVLVAADDTVERRAGVTYADLDDAVLAQNES